MESTTANLLLLHLILWTAWISRATAESSSEPEPIMLSTPSNLKIMQGDTVLLPCKVINLGRNVVRVWKKLPSNMLFSGNIVVDRDQRISLQNGSLQIENVTPDYAGEYVCQISKHPQLSVVHRIQVNVPPSVKPDPPEGRVVFRKGDTASILCNPSGIPKPHVTWTYGDENAQGTALPSGARQVQGSELQFSSVDVHHAGVYKCMAENDVGQPAVATFILIVHYAPELLVKPEWAHGDEGAPVDFVCICKAYPPAQVSWKQGDHRQGKKLETNGRVRIKQKQTASNIYEHTLRIQKLTRDDLGPYTCVAKNLVGDTWKTVEISGLAEPVLLRGNQSGEGSFLLRWKAKSYSPIIEYQLKIRKHKSGDPWTDVVIPAATQEGQSSFYTGFYNVTGLDAGTRYEAVLQAHNDFGWNRPSETFFFGEEPPPALLEIEETKTEPSLLPLYEAELDVTDPTYLKQSSKARKTTNSLPLSVFEWILLICAHLILC